MKLNEIYNDPRIITLKNHYIQKGLNFQVDINKAIDKATANIKDPTVEAVVNSVVKELEMELALCIINKAGGFLTNLFKGLFRKKNKNIENESN